MGPLNRFSAHAYVEIARFHKIELGYAVLETGICFSVLNRMKGQIIQRKTAIRVQKWASNTFYEWLEAPKQVKIERTLVRNNLRHEGTQAQKMYIGT